MTSIRHILVPVDFGATSVRALDEAVDLAAKLGASITVLHAHQLTNITWIDGGFTPTPEVAAAAMGAAQGRLDELVATRQGRGVELRTLLRDGDPRDEIAAVADEKGVDLVVIGTHGRGPIARALLGSVAPHVLRTVKQPVLTVPPPRA